ncbi:MAG: pirin family protein [Acidobacteriota bacterium]|nr:pirin family protein [Acidobacteriota bacterium]MDH3529518.1 pirin family protein [Acidobacteriota bacterium]
MIKIRRANERGHANYGWLDTNHTFSFNTYHDPAYMGFRALRVINEDRVKGGEGFGTHGHNDMEIISYVVEGALAHKDSTGGEEVLRPHEFQRMTAGTGIKHSEFNPSKEDSLHFFQIWILPEKNGLEPGYEQKLFPPEEKTGMLKLVASRGGEDGSLHINRDVRVYSSVLEQGNTVKYEIQDGRHVWIQMVSGSLAVNGRTIGTSDGAAVSDETSLSLTASEQSEFILFDLD